MMKRRIRFSLRTIFIVITVFLTLLGYRSSHVHTQNVAFAELEREGWVFAADENGDHLFVTWCVPARSTLTSNLSPNYAHKKTGVVTPREFQLLSQMDEIYRISLGPGVQVDANTLRAINTLESVHELSIASSIDVTKCESDLLTLTQLGELQLRQESFSEDAERRLRRLLPSTSIILLTEEEIQDLWDRLLSPP